jgi:hypothetical protein
MPIRLALREAGAFTPEQTEMLVAVFEATLQQLGPIDRDDPQALAVAKKIISIAKRGERDPDRLRTATLVELERDRINEGSGG